MQKERTEEQVIEQAATTQPESETPEEETALEAKQPTEPEPAPAPEPISDEPGAEVSSEPREAETRTVQEQLADKVKACLIERSSCENLGSKLDDAAKELGISVGDLIDQVFEIVKGKKAEQDKETEQGG